MSILTLNLKELLYLSIEKSSFFTNLHLQYLNSFQRDITRNKPFKPLLRADSRVKYFNFFSCLLAFLFRTYQDCSYKTSKLYSLSREALGLLRELGELAELQGQESSLEDLDLEFRQAKKALDKRLSKYKLRVFLEQGKLVEEEEFDEEGEGEGSEEEEGEGREGEEVESLASEDSTTRPSSPITSSRACSPISSLGSVKSESCTLLEEVKLVGESRSVLSIQIQEKLLALLVVLAKQKINIDIFSSPVNAFLACKSIKESTLSLRDSQDLSQYYSYLIYCFQLVALEHSLQDATAQNNPSLILENIKNFMHDFFNNSSPTCLGEILNNRSYAFERNKNLSSLSNIIIEPGLKETLTYKKVTLSREELQGLFRQAVLDTSTILYKRLLLDIPISSLTELTLESFSVFEDPLNTTPCKCFKDFSPNIGFYNTFLQDQVLAKPKLRNRFFSLKEQRLIIKPRQLKLYTQDVKEFLKFCLLLVHWTSGLPLRGTELCTLKFLNSFRDRRELILDRSSYLFILNIIYKKTLHSSSL